MGKACFNCVVRNIRKRHGWKDKLLTDSSHGAANRRSAALSAIAPKIASLQCANPMPANKVKEAADELMTFLSDNAAVQQPATSAHKVTRH